MNRRRSAAIILIGLATLIGGCATRQAKLTPIGVTPIVYPADEDLIEIHTRLGFALKLTLPPPKQPGYVWEITTADPRYLQQTGAVRPVAGRPGAASVTFQAKKGGRTTLCFFAVPPTALREADPAGKCEAIVLIE